MQLKPGDRVLLLEHPYYKQQEFYIRNIKGNFALVANSMLGHLLRWPVDKLKKIKN